MARFDDMFKDIQRRTVMDLFCTQPMATLKASVMDDTDMCDIIHLCSLTFVHLCFPSLVNRMIHVDAGGDLFVTAVGLPRPRNDSLLQQGPHAICLDRPGAMTYRITGAPMRVFLMGTTFKYSSCGPHACWLINHRNQVFVSKVRER